MRLTRTRALIFVLAAALITGCTTPPAGQGQVAVGGPSSSSAAPTTSPAPAPITVPTVGLGSSAVPSTTSVAISALPVADGAIGSVGIGDPYYPTSGNGGYQAGHYDIAVTYDPVTNALSAVTTITGTVTEPTTLGRFDFDLQPTMVVSAVTVNGKPAAFAHPGAELVINPATGLASGSGMTVVVTYRGTPAAIPGGTATVGAGGWYRTPSGGAIAIGEPFSGSAWYPVNEHPSDTATYRVTATVPQKWSVISNGVQATTGLPAAPAGAKVFRWTQTHAITSYEETIYIDTFTTATDATADGKPIVSVFAPGDGPKDKQLAGNTRQVVQVLSNHFGPYPFDAAGGIYTNQRLAFALETATRPVYADWANLDTVVHEFTHQWFGDDVVIKRWSDICVNECFASYGPWLWHQDVDHEDLDATWVNDMASEATAPNFWTIPLVDMGAGKEFTSVYTRGPLAIHALRKQMGEKDFAALLKGWPATYAGQPESYQDLANYVNKVSGQDLTAFMDAWFRATTKPPAQFLHPGGIGK